MKRSNVTSAWPDDVFDSAHYAATMSQKVKRALELGPKYYVLDLPRYVMHRRAHGLPALDVQAIANPLREFLGRLFHRFELPPRYGAALQRLHAAGVRLSLPRARIEALAGAWWATRYVRGDAIECGAYKGATSVLIALLGEMHGIPQRVFALDTFEGIPATSSTDLSRRVGEFAAGPGHVQSLLGVAQSLGIRARLDVRKGTFADTFADRAMRGLHFVFAHIDANVYGSTREACEFVIPRIRPGGVVVFDDYNGMYDLGARLAIDAYLAPMRRRPRALAGTSAFLTC